MTILPNYPDKHKSEVPPKNFFVNFLGDLHFYIFANKNIKKETIEKLINYMNKNFPNYKSNKFKN